MELFFLILLGVLMATALGMGYPVAFALPGAAILTILLAGLCGWIFAGHVDAFFAQGGPSEWLSAGVTNFRGVYWEVERDTLIAVPLFIFMGIMLQRSKIAEDLLMTMAQLFGPIPGGLGISVVFVGALLAATTGIVGATVVAMGLISLPAMMRNKYSIPLSCGTIAASGTLGQIIPPSIVLIILADQMASAVDQAQTARTELYKAATGEVSMPSEFAITSTSAGDMFMGALIPGLVLVALYMILILVVALIRPRLAPSVPFEEKLDLRLVFRVVMILVPPLALIFAVLGSIIAGVATVNQAGAIGAIGATIMASYRLHADERGAYWPTILAVGSLLAIAVLTSLYDTNIRNLGTGGGNGVAIWLTIVAVALFIVAVLWALWRAFRIDNTLTLVMLETAKTTSLVFIILIGAAMLTAAFRAFGGEDLVRDFLVNLPGGFWSQFVIVMAVIFILGFFIDFIEIVVVVVPIVTPILLMDPAANITAVWLGVMYGMNIQTSFLTPPFGFALFYLRGVAPPGVTTLHIYKGVVPFILLQLLGLGIVGAMPQLVNYLPTRISLTSETAPPPVNPRLQYCIERYIAEQFELHGDGLRAAIERARALPLDELPEDQADDLREAFATAGEAFAGMQAIQAAEAAVATAAPGYRPLHIEVRAIERDAARHARRIETLRTDLTRVRNLQPDSPRIAVLEARIAEVEAERAALLASIPAEWEERHAAFSELTAAGDQARRAFQRTTDDAFEPVVEISNVLQATPALAALEADLAQLSADVAGAEPAALVERIEALRSAMREAEAGDDIIDGLSDARDELRRDPDKEAAAAALDESMAALTAELEWRRRAETAILPGLMAYQDELGGTIGLRQQPVLPREQALYVTACTSSHRDVSLSF
jgi:TRAP-type mannitol/chloroaromatic compound transport system permease large subunit